MPRRFTSPRWALKKTHRPLDVPATPYWRVATVCGGVRTELPLLPVGQQSQADAAGQIYYRTYDALHAESGRAIDVTLLVECSEDGATWDVDREKVFPAARLDKAASMWAFLRTA